MARTAVNQACSFLRVELLGNVDRSPHDVRHPAGVTLRSALYCRSGSAVRQVRGEDAGCRTRQEVLVDDRLGLQDAGLDERGNLPPLQRGRLLRSRTSGNHAGIGTEREEAETGEAQVALGGGQPLVPHLRCHVRTTELRVVGQAAVH